MAAIAKNILVVGGNGFIGKCMQRLALALLLTENGAGSAVCRAALAKGMQVTSVRLKHILGSSSG